MVEQSEEGDFPQKMAEFAPEKLDITPPNAAAPATLTFRAPEDGLHPQPCALARQPLFDQYSFRPQLQPPLPPAAHPAIAPMTSESQQLPRPRIDVSEGKDSAARKKKQCSCKHSKCLKLYCECLAAGLYCDGCKCVNCHNNVANETSRREAVEAILERNRFAFRPKIACSSDAVQDSKKFGLQQKVKDGVVIEKHSKGCNCKKSGCLKKYCECFQANIPCSDLCRCVDCKNQEGSEERQALLRKDNASNTAYKQHEVNAAISSAIGSSGPPLFKKRKVQEHLFGSAANDPPSILGYFQKNNPVDNSLPSSASMISGSHLSSSSGIGAFKYSYRSLLADLIGPQDLKDLCSVLVEAAKTNTDKRSASGRPSGESRETHLASPEDKLCTNQKASSVEENASLNGCLNVSQSHDIIPEELDLDDADVPKATPLSPATLALMCDEQDTMFTTVASPAGVSGQSNMPSQPPSAEEPSEVFSEQERMVLTKFRDCLSKLITLGDIKEMKCSSFAHSESYKRDGMSYVNASDWMDALNQQLPSSNAFCKAATDQLLKAVPSPLEIENEGIVKN